MKKNDKGTILNETTIRRFMKLANIAPLTENYLGQFTEEDEEPEVEMGGESDMGADMGDMGDMGDMDAAPAEGGASGVSQEAVEEIVQAIASAVEEVTGTSVSAEPAADVEAPADMGDEPEMDMGGEEPDPATRYEAKHSDDEEVEEGKMAYKREDDEEVEEGKKAYKREDDEEVEEGKMAYKREDDEEVDEAKEEDDDDTMKSEQLINRIAKKVVERLQREMK